MTRRPKLAIVGHGRSGKDTAAEWFRDHTPLRYSRSTSSVILPYIVSDVYGLPIEDCTYEKYPEEMEYEWKNRHEWRNHWYNKGIELRRDDPAFLARTVLADGEDIVVGIRDRIEIQTTRDEGLVDLVIWIDRDIPPDPTLTYGVEMADIVIPNRWDLAEFYGRIARLARSIGLIPHDRDMTQSDWSHESRFLTVLDGKTDGYRGSIHPIQAAHDHLEFGS